MKVIKVIVITSYKGKDYNRFIRVLAGSSKQEDLKVAWDLAWKMKQFKRDIILPCYDEQDAECLQNKLRDAGAVCHAVQS